MKIYVLNLARSQDRREHMERELGRLSLGYEIFDAIDGSKGEHLRFPNYSRDECLRRWRRPMTAGEVACFASHYLLWQQCVASHEPVVVIEDDASVSEQLMEILRILPKLERYGYCRLSTIVSGKCEIIDAHFASGARLVRYLGEPQGTQCYVVFPRAAAKLISFAETWTQPVDNYLDSFWEHGVTSLGIDPPLVSHNLEELDSTIWSVHSPSTLLRGEVWRPKRIACHVLRNIRRTIANFQYRIGLRRVADGS